MICELYLLIKYSMVLVTLFGPPVCFYSLGFASINRLGYHPGFTLRGFSGVIRFPRAFRSKVGKISKQTAPLHILLIIIQHIDTLPKYDKKTLDVRRST